MKIDEINMCIQCSRYSSNGSFFSCRFILFPITCVLTDAFASLCAGVGFTFCFFPGFIAIFILFPSFFHYFFLKTRVLTDTSSPCGQVLVEGGGERWEAIASQFLDRSELQCQQRWSKVLNPELVKGPWTKEVS